MLIPSAAMSWMETGTSLSRRVNANSQLRSGDTLSGIKLIKKGEC